jgi:hypothetical protein
VWTSERLRYSLLTRRESADSWVAGDEIERQTEFLFKCVRSGLSIREPPTRGLLHLFFGARCDFDRQH